MIIRNKFNGYVGGNNRLYPGGGGSQPTNTTQTTTTIPEYARPYVERMLGKAEAFSDSPYQAYGGERVAGFTPMQEQAFQGAANLSPAQQIGQGTQLAGQAGANAAKINYQGGDFANQYQRPAGFQSGAFANQYQGPQDYQAGAFGTFGVSGPSLQQFQMGPAERARTQSFIGPGTAEAYMSPYQQAVTDIEKREAARSSNIMQQQQQAQAVQQGAFGGSRSAIVEAERQRNLGQQLGDIQARGGQASFQQAQQQFNAEQQARLQAQLANQQAGLTVGGQNLSALLGVQQLGAGQNMQSQLANQQMMMEAQRMGEQSRQYGYGQGMTRSQLEAQYGTEAQRMAEQSRQFGYGQDMTAAQLGAQYGTEAQRMGEQSRQFGANLGLQGLQQQLAAASTLGQLGQTQFGQEQGAIQAQAAAGAQQQGLEQQRMSQAYQDFLTQRGYPQQQLAFMSDILRGVPLGQQTQVQYQAPPPMTSQLAQLGLGAYGVSQMFKKEGGIIKMAEGGIAGAAPQGSVPNTMPIDKLRSVLGDMSEEQLDQVAQGAGDATTLALVQEQKNLNARIRNSGILAESLPQTTIKEEMIAPDGMTDSGIAAAPMPAAMFADTAVGEAPEEAPAMRGGGIVAFAKGREVKAPPDDVSAFRAIDPSKAVMTDEERVGAEEKGLARLEKFLGPDRSVELAEKVAKASELGPEAESRAKMAAAFEMMAAFGEPTPFATAFGKAGAIAGRNIKEFEKLKRESEKEANKLRLDTARYERAEKMQRYGEANKIADRIEDRKTKLFTLDADIKKTLADVQVKREATASSERVGMAGVAATRAGQFNLDREFLSAETQRGIEDYRARNNGKDPVGQELANIRSEAATKVAEMKRYNPYGASNVDIRLQSEITEAQRYDEGIKNLRAKYLMADDKDKPAIQAEIQARLDEVARTVQSRVQRPGVPTTTTQPPPPAGNQPTTKAEYDKLPRGATYIDPNGVQRIKG